MIWGDIYTHIIMATGWTWDHIAEHMDIPRLRAMQSYWKENPPVHILVAAYMGVGKKSKKPPKPPTAAALESMMASFPQAQQPQPRMITPPVGGN